MKRAPFIISLVGIVFLSLFGILTWVGNSLHPLERDLMVGGTGVLSGIKNFVQNFSSVSRLRSERETLIIENDRLRQEVAELQLLSRENEELRKFANFVEKERAPSVTTRLYGFQSVNPHKGFLNAGSNQGVQKDDWVVGSGGNLIGRVASVRGSMSEVIFISSSEISLQVVGSDSAEIIGVTQGGNAVEISLGFIPKSVHLQRGMNLYSAVEQGLQKEYLIGSIDSVTSEPSDVFQRAVVTLFQPLSQITYASALHMNTIP